MEYRFSLTPRLAAIGACACLALMALVFALGFVLGKRMDGPEPADAAAAAPAPAAAASPAGAAA